MHRDGGEQSQQNIELILVIIDFKLSIFYQKVDLHRIDVA